MIFKPAICGSTTSHLDVIWLSWLWCYEFRRSGKCVSVLFTMHGLVHLKCAVTGRSSSLWFWGGSCTHASCGVQEYMNVVCCWPAWAHVDSTTCYTFGWMWCIQLAPSNVATPTVNNWLAWTFMWSIVTSILPSSVGFTIPLRVIKL